jgi:hypothetical protein
MDQTTQTELKPPPRAIPSLEGQGPAHLPSLFLFPCYSVANTQTFMKSESLWVQRDLSSSSGSTLCCDSVSLPYLWVC